MNRIAAVLSMMHERAGQRDSATRLFRSQPVLWWTLERLSRSQRLSATSLLCWEDQLPAAEPVAADHDAHILAKGPRSAVAELDAVSAARRWSDGWRGGLHGTCEFDKGFHASWLLEICDKLEADALVLIDPASGLIDSRLVDGLIKHSGAQPDAEICFSPAAPGTSGVFIRRSLIERLAAARLHPGKLFSYNPDQPSQDPISAAWCAPTPTSIARTTHRFTLDSDRQLSRVSLATISLNGQLMGSDAEIILNHLDHCTAPDSMPRELTLEINTQRATKPLWSPAKHLNIERSALSTELARRIFDEIANVDDLRLTLAGVGDPILSENFFEILDAASDAGVASVHVETDLFGIQGDPIKRLAESGVDVVSIHVPAATAQVYQQVMGADGLTQVIMNIRSLVEHRARRGRGTPLIVPTFIKCRENLGEMEIWYDRWLSALGSAVIVGPSDFCGQIPDFAVADMSPPRRKACARLKSRMSVLSDGSVVSCEQDVQGRHLLGNARTDSLAEIWQQKISAMLQDHRQGHWNKHSLCGGCREWHRP